MIYSNVNLKPVMKNIDGTVEYCIVLGDHSSKRPLILVCDVNTHVKKGMNKDLSIEYYNDKLFRIRKYKESTCYFLISTNVDKELGNGKIKITKKEYPHCSVLAKGYDKCDISDIQRKADYVLLRSPSWYGIIRVKIVNRNGFYNNIYVVRNSKVYKFRTEDLKEGLLELGIKEDFEIYSNGNFEGKYWVTL